MVVIVGLIAAVILIFIVGNAIWNNTYSNPTNIIRPSEAELGAQGIKTIDANGLRFAYLDAGSPDKPLIVLFHGFPENAYTFDALLPALADAGYYAVAPFMRGYYPTDIPADGDYAPLTLGSDVIALIKAFHRDSAIVIGHDWGATAGYAAAILDPSRMSKLVTIAIPHPGVVKPTLDALRRAPHFVQLQFRFLSEWMARNHNFAYIDGLYAYWSPHWTPPAADIAQIKNDFARIGRLHAAIGYYTSFFANTFNAGHAALLQKPISVPTLALVGDADIVDTALFKQAETLFAGSYQIEVIPGAGHFIQQEAPDVVIEHILSFLGAHQGD